MSSFTVGPMVRLSESPAGSSSKAATRLASLDIFRGATVAFMLLVNNPGRGRIYDPLEHAPWNGWTPTDLVFPFFLFIMGVAIPFSLAKRSVLETKGQLFLHVLVRGLSLFLLGEFVYSQPYLIPKTAVPWFVQGVRWFAVAFLFAGYVLLLYPWKSKARSLLIPPIVAVIYLLILFSIHGLNAHYGVMNGVDAKSGYGLLDPDHLRIPGILQRIGICYMAAATLALVGSWHVLLVAAIALLAVNGWLMLKVPYPSVVDGHMVHGLLTKEDNLARHVDVHVLGKHVYPSYPDPEGIVSSICAIATSIFGVLVGIWLRTTRPASDRCAGLLSFGVLMAFIGAALGLMLIPINKQIYTPSYSIFCAGLAMLGLGLVFYFADVLQYRLWGLPFKIYGMNAIAAFVFSAIFGRLIRINPSGSGPTIYQTLVDHAATLGERVRIGDPHANASLAFAISYVLFFLFVLSILYLCRIFLKV